MPDIQCPLGFGLAVSVVIPAFVGLVRKKWPAKASQSAGQQATALQPPGKLMPGIPTLSALLGQNPNVSFDSKKFFALAHYSPITAEVEHNIKIVAEQASPNDKEAFYARFIGIGAVVYHHDVTWLTSFGSQLAAMAEMSRRGLIPIVDVKKHYDQAVIAFPKTYANYSFDQWMDYMTERMLIARYPSHMVELSFNGRDFLSYIAHTGKDAKARLN